MVRLGQRQFRSVQQQDSSRRITTRSTSSSICFVLFRCMNFGITVSSKREFYVTPMETILRLFCKKSIGKKLASISTKRQDKKKAAQNTNSYNENERLVAGPHGAPVQINRERDPTRSPKFSQLWLSIWCFPSLPVGPVPVCPRCPQLVASKWLVCKRLPTGRLLL